MEVLHRIKRLLLRGQFKFSFKAAHEMDVDELDEADVVGAVINATEVAKVLRSSSQRGQAGENSMSSKATRTMARKSTRKARSPATAKKKSTTSSSLPNARHLGIEARPLSVCPMCGSRKIARERIQFTLRDERRVPIMADVCPQCGEAVLDRVAMATIEAARKRSR